MRPKCRCVADPPPRPAPARASPTRTGQAGFGGPHFKEGPRAAVLHDFAAGSPIELSVARGDSVALRRPIDEHWVLCTDAEGGSGMVPLNCLRVLEDLPPGVMLQQQ